MNHLEASPMRFHPRFTFLFITPDGDVLRNGVTRLPQSKVNGYPRIHVRGHGGESVHRLVADVYCTKPDGATQVNHIDGDQSNNHFSNLEWCTPGDNIRHAIRTGLKPRKFSVMEVCGIRDAYNSGSTIRELSANHGVSYEAISSILTGRSYPDAAGALKPKIGRGGYGGDVHHSAKTTEASRQQIITRAATGERRSRIASDLGVSLRCVYKIIRRGKTA